MRVVVAAFETTETLCMAIGPIRLWYTVRATGPRIEPDQGPETSAVVPASDPVFYSLPMNWSGQGT